MTVRHDSLLDVATRVLIATPGASLGDVAAAAGVSRSTLHSRFPTRQSLLVALALEAMDLITRAYERARPDDGPAEDAIRRIVEQLIPLGPRVEFLLRERSLDSEPEVVRRYEDLDLPLLRLVERGQQDGSLRRDLPSWWVVSSLTTAVYGAWDAIAYGKLAPLDAPGLVTETTLFGLVAR